jgi:hypothetical protein
MIMTGTGTTVTMERVVIPDSDEGSACGVQPARRMGRGRAGQMTGAAACLCGSIEVCCG